MRLDLIHDRLPGAFGEGRVLGRQTVFQDELLVGGIGGGLAVRGFQRLLPARAGVLK